MNQLFQCLEPTKENSTFENTNLPFPKKETAMTIAQ